MGTPFWRGEIIRTIQSTPPRSNSVFDGGWNSPDETKIVPLVYSSAAFGLESVPWHSNQPPRITSGIAPPQAPVRTTVPPVSITNEPRLELLAVPRRKRAPPLRTVTVPSKRTCPDVPES